MTKLRHYDNPGEARFITFCCHNKLPFFKDEKDFLIFIEELDKARAKHNFKMLGYVVMPNHVHLLLLPPNDMKLGLVIGEIKSLSARRILGRWRSDRVSMPDSIRVKRGERNKVVFWQRRCYDRNCRNEKELLQSIEYCHNNPVARGLAEYCSAWRWSSYNSYVGRGEAPLGIDLSEANNPPQGVGYTCGRN